MASRKRVRPQVLRMRACPEFLGRDLGGPGEQLKIPVLKDNYRRLYKLHYLGYCVLLLPVIGILTNLYFMGRVIFHGSGLIPSSFKRNLAWVDQKGGLTIYTSG